MLEEYYQFSPRLANEISYSHSLKILVSKLLIEPLLDFFTLGEIYLRQGRKQKKNFSDKVRATFEQALNSLLEIGALGNRWNIFILNCLL